MKIPSQDIKFKKLELEQSLLRSASAMKPSNDLYSLVPLISVNQIKTSAYFHNDSRYILALVLGTGGLVIYSNLKHHAKPIVRWIPWFEDSDKTIQSLSFQPSSGSWIVIICYDGSLYILPVAWLIDFENIGLASNSEWMLNDVTYFPPSSNNFVPTSVSWWERKIGSPRHVAIIGGKSGKIEFRSLSNGLLLGRTTVSGDITSLVVFKEDFRITTLLITNEHLKQWKLVLENLEERFCWLNEVNSVNPADEQFSQSPFFPPSRVRFQVLRQLSAETMANIRQKISDNRNRGFNSLKRKDSSSSDDSAYRSRLVPSAIYNQVCYVSMGESQREVEPINCVYIPRNPSEIPLVQISYGASGKLYRNYKLPPSEVTTVGMNIHSDYFLFIANSSATQLSVFATNLMEMDKYVEESEFNSQSLVQKIDFGDDERIQALYRTSCLKYVSTKYEANRTAVFGEVLPQECNSFMPISGLNDGSTMKSSKGKATIEASVFDTCLVITNKSVYLLNLNDHPSSYTLKLLNSNESLERVEWITKIFCLDRQIILESAANQQLEAGNCEKALHFLKLAKATPLECALRLACAGFIEELIAFITSITHQNLAAQERRRLSELCILAFVEHILRVNDKSFSIKKFLKLLNEDMYYRECYAVQTVGKCYLFPILKYFLCERGLLEDVAQVIHTITSENSVKFLELHEGFWDLLSENCLAEILLQNNMFALDFMKLIQSQLSSLPENILQRLCHLFDPTRSCVKPLLKIMFQYLTSNKKSREIISQTKYSYATDVDSEVRYPLQNWITVYILIQLHLLHKTQSIPFNFDVLNFVALKFINPPKGNLLKTFSPTVLSAGLAYGSVILEKRVYTWGQDRFGCLGRITETSFSPPDYISWFNFPKVEVYSVACGRYHTLALTSNGVYGWGSSNFGQLGIVGLKKSPNPRVIEALSTETIVFVAAGQYHSLAISAKGHLWTWGWGVHGQLGTGSIEDSPVPKVVTHLMSQVIAQAAGGYAHSIVLTTKGRVFVFGSSCYGQLGTGSPMKKTTPIEVYGLSEPISQIASGYFHNLALSKSNRLYTWGSSPQVLRLQTAAQKRRMNFEKTIRNGENDSFSNFSSPENNVLTSGSDLSGNDFYKENIPDQNRMKKSLSPSVDPDLCINSVSEVSYLRTSNFEAEHSKKNFLMDDASTHLSPMLVDTSNVSGKIVAISCGCHHSALLDEQGTVYTWGVNLDGQLGDGSRKEYPCPRPIRVNQLKLSSDSLILHVPLQSIPIRNICCGADFTIGMEASGRLWGWGSNQFGQLGTDPTVYPEVVTKPSKAKSGGREGKGESKTKRVLKVPYAQVNIMDTPQIISIPSYQNLNFSEPIENKLPCTTISCPIYLPFEILHHNLQPLSLVDSTNHGVASLHYILECFHNCYHVELVKNTCLETHNYQALAKINHLNKCYHIAFMNHLKALIATNLTSLDTSSVGLISNSKKTIKSTKNKTGELVSLEVIIPNLTADMIVKSKSENMINSRKVCSSSLERMNVSESKATNTNQEETNSHVKMEISENRTWIQSDDTLEEQSSITSMSNSDIMYRSENTNSQCNHVEEISKKLPISIDCDNEIFPSSPDSLSFDNKERSSLCDENDVNSGFSKQNDTDKQSYQTFDKSECSSIDVLDSGSNDESALGTNNILKDSDLDPTSKTYEEESLNRLNVLNSLNSEIKDILLGTGTVSYTGSNCNLVLSQSDGINTCTFEVNNDSEEAKLAKNALELFQFYLEVMKKGTKTELLNFLKESIACWISHQLPVKYLETLFETQWDEYANYLGIILICGIDGNPDYVSTQKMLHHFSLKFNLRLCSSLVESVTSTKDIHPELVKLLANALAAPNSEIKLNEKQAYDELLSMTMSKLKGETPTQPFINIEPTILNNEIIAFSCGHRFSSGGALQHATSKAAADLEDQSFPNIAHELRELFDQHLVIRKFACPDCVSSFFLSKNITL